MTDEELLAAAREIQAREGVSLTDAMILAEERAREAAPAKNAYTVTLELKPKVAKWVAGCFTPTPTHTPEERLAAFLVQYLNRVRVTDLRNAAGEMEVQEGSAVTVKRGKIEALKRGM